MPIILYGQRQTTSQMAPAMPKPPQNRTEDVVLQLRVHDRRARAAKYTIAAGPRQAVEGRHMPQCGPDESVRAFARAESKGTRGA